MRGKAHNSIAVKTSTLSPACFDRSRVPGKTRIQERLKTSVVLNCQFLCDDFTYSYGAQFYGSFSILTSIRAVQARRNKLPHKVS